MVQEWRRVGPNYSTLLFPAINPVYLQSMQRGTGPVYEQNGQLSSRGWMDAKSWRRWIVNIELMQYYINDRQRFHILVLKQSKAL